MDNLSFIYEPYSIGLILASIFTGIYFLMNNNNEDVSDKSDYDVSDIKNKRRLKKPEHTSRSVKSILFFICSFVVFTGGLYFYKSVKTPIESIEIVSNIKQQLTEIISPSPSQSDEGMIEDILSKENVDEIFTVNQDNKKKISVDESFIAGKKRRSSKNREYRHMSSKEAKYMGNDIDMEVSPF